VVAALPEVLSLVALQDGMPTQDVQPGRRAARVVAGGEQRT